jgi:DnaJ-class molecular chaperone
MISSFTPTRSAELAPEAGARDVREAQAQAPVGVEVAPIAALAPSAAPLEAPAPILCPHCGGSGILRMGDQQFRTCLECLGQGQLSSTVQQELLFPAFGLRVSAARAG